MESEHEIVEPVQGNNIFGGRGKLKCAWCRRNYQKQIYRVSEADEKDDENSLIV
jgi:hypothetical protein